MQPNQLAASEYRVSEFTVSYLL